MLHQHLPALQQKINLMHEKSAGLREKKKELTCSYTALHLTTSDSALRCHQTRDKATVPAPKEPAEKGAACDLGRTP